MAESVTGFALGEGIPISYPGSSMLIKGVKPTTDTGLTFYFTVKESATPRTEMVRKISGSGLAVSVVDDEVNIELEINTGQASPAYVVGKEYEADLWVKDTTNPPARLDTFKFSLDQPETTDFSIS